MCPAPPWRLWSSTLSCSMWGLLCAPCVSTDHLFTRNRLQTWLPARTAFSGVQPSRSWHLVTDQSLVCQPFLAKEWAISSCQPLYRSDWRTPAGWTSCWSLNAIFQFPYIPGQLHESGLSVLLQISPAISLVQIRTFELCCQYLKVRIWRVTHFAWSQSLCDWHPKLNFLFASDNQR